MLSKKDKIDILIKLKRVEDDIKRTNHNIDLYKDDTKLREDIYYLSLHGYSRALHSEEVYIRKGDIYYSSLNEKDSCMWKKIKKINPPDEQWIYMDALAKRALELLDEFYLEFEEWEILNKYHSIFFGNIMKKILEEDEIIEMSKDIEALFETSTKLIQMGKMVEAGELCERAMNMLNNLTEENLEEIKHLNHNIAKGIGEAAKLICKIEWDNEEIEERIKEAEKCIEKGDQLKGKVGHYYYLSEQIQKEYEECKKILLLLETNNEMDITLYKKEIDEMKGKIDARLCEIEIRSDITRIY